MTVTDAQSAAVLGGAGQVLADEEVIAFIHQQLAGANLDGRSVCVIVPDATRSCPLPLLLRAVHGALTGKVSRLTVLVALGTHAEMSAAELATHLGGEYDVLNHEWWKEETFADLGTISADRVGEISNGLLHEAVPIRLNRAVVEHDVALVVGPVFPHEVVGFSGGNKYFFPGVAGQEVIDLSHWLGALITSAGIIGTPGITPVRALINEAAALIPAEKLALSVVAQSGTNALHAVAFGDTQSSWQAAAAVSAETHVRYLDRPVRRVVSLMPSRYQDIWTAAKGFYKVEPIVADGGEVIIYAPHITQIAAMHPEIEQIGYHCRDYFLGQWEQFRSMHWGVLAHSTHLRGAGTWDPVEGERCRVDVTLATGIPEEIVRGANLGYLDPAGFDLTQYEEDPETLVLPNAGEILHRLRRD
ncbi:lactate racemase domain-containing protein [Kribbella sp. NPDC056861]|uniref:lactate racemase domain-containing protein n=1 Tax=Kribbella sp. NPDC056861 TaxID=3154857 RepID=UPI003424F168